MLYKKIELTPEEREKFTKKIEAMIARKEYIKKLAEIKDRAELERLGVFLPETFYQP